MKFRKKPVTIEAIQWNGSNVTELYAFTKGVDDVRYSDDTLIIPTLEGDMVATKGDWIIKGIKGEYYPCKPDIFEATYEPVEE